VFRNIFEKESQNIGPGFWMTFFKLREPT